MAAGAPQAGPTVLIMAAGHGTRMRSALPKVLHPVCGRPMVEWVIAAAREAGAAQVVCVTRPGEGVAEALPGDVEVAEQTSGEGTGAAILAARGQIADEADVLVLSGDVPLVAAELIAGLHAVHRERGAAATVLTTEELDPAGYGRVIRSLDGRVAQIVETKHPEGVDPAHLAVREINVGVYAFRGRELLEALDAVGETGGERYLTGVFPVLRERGLPIAAHRTADVRSAMGVNTPADLMEVERHARRRLLDEHAVAGVRFEAPESVVIDVGVEIGEDTTVGTGVTLKGATRVGRGSAIGPHATLLDTQLGDGVTVLHSYLTTCRVADGAVIGPFAYLRPDADVGERAKIGTFVEVKNSRIGTGAKVPHLSYLGDADVGAGTNVGAANVTANYDGRRKHRTTIGEGVRTGVDTTFVAPVHVGDGAYIAAGSVITEDVPPGALGVARSRQRNVEGYAERVNERNDG